jgi:hypothetical protein
MLLVGLPSNGRSMEEIERLTTAMRSAGVDSEFSAAFANAINVDPEFAHDDTPANAFGAMLGHYVIRDDDLNLLDRIADAIGTAASVEFFMGSISADKVLAAKISLAVALLKVALTVGLKGAIVDASELRILLALRTPEENAGMKSAELANAVGKTVAEVDELLARLSRYPVTRSETRAFVTLYGDRWRSAV